VILVLDNYDSFVANIDRMLREFGARTRVMRNDAADLADVRALDPEAIVISPGPCGPADAGLSNAVIRAFSGRVPILGVCLGHQCIGEVFGGRVSRAREPMHGRASPVRHDGTGLFAGLPSPLRVARYHALIVELEEADGPLAVTARTGLGEIMGLAHRVHPTVGVQFHPESILTEGGYRMIANFLALCRGGPDP
jgi:para-aminobenzoate synthetase component II